MEGDVGKSFLLFLALQFLNADIAKVDVVGSSVILEPNVAT